MVSGRARVMQQIDPRKVRVTYQGIPKWRKWAAVWENNPRIARPDEVGDFQELAARGMDNMRPYHTGKTAQRWSYNLNFRPDIGELYFSQAELAFGALYPGRIIVEPHIGPGASPNKRYPWVSWNKVAWLMQRAGLRVTQLGPIGTPLLDGAEFVETQSFRLACAVLKYASACVLSEGGLMHAAAAVNVPGVIIFGGFTPVELTGYPMHVKLGASLGEACGMRTPCEHCKLAMASIMPERVFDELRALLNA